MILLARGNDPLSVLPDPVTATGNDAPLVDEYHPVWPHDGGNMAQNFSVAIEDLERKRGEVGISGTSAGDLCDACHRSLEVRGSSCDCILQDFIRISLSLLLFAIRKYSKY